MPGKNPLKRLAARTSTAIRRRYTVQRSLDRYAKPLIAKYKDRMPFTSVAELRAFSGDEKRSKWPKVLGEHVGTHTRLVQDAMRYAHRKRSNGFAAFLRRMGIWSKRHLFRRVRMEIPKDWAQARAFKKIFDEYSRKRDHYMCWRDIMEARISPQPDYYKVRHFIHVMRLRILLDVTHNNHEKSIAFYSSDRANEMRILESEIESKLNKASLREKLRRQENILEEEILHAREKLNEIEADMKWE